MYVCMYLQKLMCSYKYRLVKPALSRVGMKSTLPVHTKNVGNGIPDTIASRNIWSGVPSISHIPAAPVRERPKWYFPSLSPLYKIQSDNQTANG